MSQVPPAPAGRLLGLLLTRFAFRHARDAWKQTLAIVLIVATGVAVVLAVRLANRAAAASFTHFTDAVAGSSDWIVRAASGDLDASHLRKLRERMGSEPVLLFPVLEATAAAPRRAGDEDWGRDSWQLLGIDLAALRNLAAVQRNTRGLLDAPEEFGGAAAGGRDRFWSLLEGEPAVFLGESAARRVGLKVGSKLPLVLDDRIVELEVGGILPALEGQPEPASNLLVLDIAALQKLTSREGRLDRIEVWVEDGPGRAERSEALRTMLEGVGADRWIVESPAASRRTGETMTAAFRLNLTILSLLALAVGGFLVVEAMDGAVVRRRREIAILRSLGVRPRQIEQAWLAEAIVFGVAGSMIGCVAGYLAAQGAVQLVGRTVNALYFQTTVDAATLTGTEVMVALFAGIALSAAAGWLPARAAASTPPAEMLPRGALDAGWKWSLGLRPGLALLVAGAALLPLPPLQLEGGGRFPLAGYATALLWLGGVAWMTPAALGLVARALKPAGAWSPELRLALSRFWRPSGRHRLAVAGLVFAVGMTSAMAVMVSSFDRTVQSWISNVLQADLFIASEGAQSASSENRLPERTWQSLLADPSVADGAPMHGARIRIDGLPTYLAGADFEFLSRRDAMTWLKKPSEWERGLAAPLHTGAVPGVVSEAFAARFRVEVGEIFEIPGEPAPLKVRVEGIYADYGNERGTVMIDRKVFTEHYRDSRAATLTLVLKAGEDVEAVAAHMQQQWPALKVHSQSSLRAQVVRIFNQTFAITHALEIVGLGVALLGLGLSLASVLLDRREELSTLRALGMGRWSLARASGWEGAIVAVASCIGGLALSLMLGWLLVAVINRQSFGWTLRFEPPWLLLLAFALLVSLCGWCVAALVGRLTADLPSDREE